MDMLEYRLCASDKALNGLKSTLSVSSQWKLHSPTYHLSKSKNVYVSRNADNSLKHNAFVRFLVDGVACK